MHQIDHWIQFFDWDFFNLFDRSVVLRELITKIRQYIQPPANVIEVGCGSGWSAILLSSMGYKVTAIDAHPDLINSLKKFETVLDDLSFQCMDMFHLEFDRAKFELAFSQGVLEHYSDSEIIAALREQKRVAMVIVIDVPNARGKIGDYGDERVITPGHWRQLIQSAGLEIVAESTRGMARWSQINLKLLGWLEDSWLSRRFGENSIFVTHS